jgi:ATP-binding cassette subfamily B protein
MAASPRKSRPRPVVQIAASGPSSSMPVSRLTALRCLFLLSKHRGVVVATETLLKSDPSDTVNSALALLRDEGIAGKLQVDRDWAMLSSLKTAYPVMIERSDGTWVVIANTVKAPNGLEMAGVLDPQIEAEGVKPVTRDDIEATWTGRIVLCKRQYRLKDEQRPFGLAWFMPEILRNSRYFRDITIAAMMSNLISLATPVMFNVMIDKVVPHHSYNTLVTVITVFLGVTFFDSIFSYIRQYLMLFATNKIDARLASRTFEHMLRLPLHFFEAKSAGILLRHMQQAESIRGFLTGRIFSAMLELSALPILLITLSLYSGALMMVVLTFSLAISLVIAFMLPVFKRQLEHLYMAEGSRQADLVETIHGIRAVKSLALEGLRKTSWNQKVAASVRRRASVTHLGIIANTLTNALSQLLQLSILAVGILKVFDGTLSLGALIAFNMLSGRVTGPLLQIVALINEYQQTALSVKMLGTVMDHPPERDPQIRGITPVITGKMDFGQVHFRYDGAVSPALNRVSFSIEQGQFVGIVGRSGSGKTTLTKLIQGLYTPQEGTIQLDGTDIRHIDLAHLRQSIGVVLQDNILFRGTIRENIAAAKPEATLEEVMEAARLAGADEFIDRLPHSYETMVEESATNFSGGQRQRVAIARSLLLKPRVLLFDEATSALDPESEAIVQQNLAEIARGRTMIVVSHRLSSLANADAILVLDQGAVADYAPHSVLLQRCDVYRHLWQQQTRFMQ